MPEERTQRRSRRQARSRKPGWRIVLALLKIGLCLVAGAGLGLGGRFSFQWVEHSPWFAVRTVEIRTGARVKAEDVRKLTGIAEGKNIFSFQLAEAVRQIEIHPWVLRATVTRKLPDRVEIAVTEREPRALAALGWLYYVDQECHVFKRVLPGESLDYPVLTGLNLDQVIADQPATEVEIRKALAVLELARSSKVLPEAAISEVHLDPTFGVSVFTAREELCIRLGDGDFPERWQRLERVLVELAGDWAKVEMIDLNFQGQATVKLRAGYKLALN